MEAKNVEEDNVQHEISILDQEIRDLKESLESATVIVHFVVGSNCPCC